jgi:hypothetical protein
MRRSGRSNQETDEGKRCAALARFLTKNAPYKGPSADSGKREPAGDIDAAAVDSLKALDPTGRLESGHRWIPLSAGSSRQQIASSRYWPERSIASSEAIASTITTAP